MIRPTSNRILIEPIEQQTLLDWGFELPKAKTTFARRGGNEIQVTMGKVLAVGPGKDDKRGRRRPPDVPIGELVTFSDSCGQEVEHEGKRYIFIREDDIVGFVDKPCDLHVKAV